MHKYLILALAIFWLYKGVTYWSKITSWKVNTFSSDIWLNSRFTLKYQSVRWSNISDILKTDHFHAGSKSGPPWAALLRSLNRFPNFLTSRPGEFCWEGNYRDRIELRSGIDRPNHTKKRCFYRMKLFFFFGSKLFSYARLSIASSIRTRKEMFHWFPRMKILNCIEKF